MSPIEQSLHNLHSVISKLEDSIEVHAAKDAAKAEEHDLMLRQQELFAAENASQNAQDDKVIQLDPSLLVQRLDGAIDKVEQILQEG